jgi:glycosyltransferase involved in cell wall biosynthesis
MPSAAPRSIFLIAFYFTPEPQAGAMRPSRFFRYLPEFGYEPEVITAAVQTEKHPRIHSIPAPTYLPNKYTIPGAIEIILHKIAWPEELALLWAGAASAQARRLMKDKPQDKPVAVISTGPPLNTHLTAMRLKLRYGIPWIADFRDPMRDDPFRRFGPIPTLADGMVEKRIFHHADAVLGVSEVIEGWWRVRYPQYVNKLHVVHNGYDPAEELAARTIPPRPYRVLAYVGNLYGLRSPAIILNAVVRLLERNCLSRESIRVQFVGEVGHDLRAKAVGATMSDLEEKGILECTGLLPRPQALDLMAESDYLLMLDIQEGCQGYAIPSKLFEYVRMGRPILTVTQRDSPVHQIISRSGVPHVFVYPDDPEDTVCQKVQELFELPSDPVRPSDWFLDKFDGRKQAGTVASILDSIAGARK